MQLERIASCLTRHLRIHTIKNALYSLAKKTAQDLQKYLDQRGVAEEHRYMTVNFA